jgi:hypothetical protein
MHNYKLDLHGTKHRDVKNKVIRFVEEHWNKRRELVIITGNSVKMRDLVASVLEEYKLSYHVGYLFDDHGPRIITWT